MAVDLNNFLISFTVALAAATAGDGSPAIAAGPDLGLYEVTESRASDPRAVLIPYGGPPPQELLRRLQISIQCIITGTKAMATMALGWRLFNALYDEDVPRNNWNIPAKKLDSASLAIIADGDLPAGWNIQLVVLQQPPGLIGTDENGRHKATFNMDVTFDQQ